MGFYISRRVPRRAARSRRVSRTARELLAMQLALLGAVGIIALIAFAVVAIRRARTKRTSAVADPYDELYSELHGQIVARSLREHGEIGESDPLDATAEPEVVPDRLLEPPEWPDALSKRRAERAGVG